MTTTDMTNTTQGVRLREAGRIVARHMSPDTARALSDLARAAGTGSERAFKGGNLSLAQSVSSRILADLRARFAAAEEVQAVMRAFGMLRKTTQGRDLVPLFEGIQEVERATPVHKIKVVS